MLCQVLEDIRNLFLSISDISTELKGNKNNKIAAIIEQIYPDIRKEFFKSFIYDVEDRVFPVCVDICFPDDSIAKNTEFNIDMVFDKYFKRYTFNFNGKNVLINFVLDGPLGEKSVSIESFDEFKKYQYDEHTIRQIVHYMRIYNDILFSALLEMQDYVSMYNSMKIEK